MEPSEGKSNAEAAKYRTGVDSFQPGMQATAQDHLPPNPEFTGEWVQHAAPNGKSFYYNAATGATQWNKPSVTSTVDPRGSLQRQMPQSQGQSGQNSTQPGLTQSSQQQPTQTVHQQLPAAQQPISPATMHQGGQHSLTSYGELPLLLLVIQAGCHSLDILYTRKLHTHQYMMV